MKSLTLRSSIALACALSMAGCGGNQGNLQLAGAINGLNRDGLVLKNGNEELPVPNGAQAFAFTQLLSNDQDFEVTVKTDPDAAHCTVANGKGRTGNFNINTVVVTCVTQSKDIGGTVTGLKAGESVVLVNGSDRQEVKANGKFTMTHFAADGTTYVSGRVFVGAPYGVTVLPLPAAPTCSVTNGTGTMAKDAVVDNIQVTCG
jgi:hypothetical protein